MLSVCDQHPHVASAPYNATDKHALPPRTALKTNHNRLRSLHPTFDQHHDPNRQYRRSTHYDGACLRRQRQHDFSQSVGARFSSLHRGRHASGLGPRAGLYRCRRTIRRSYGSGLSEFGRGAALSNGRDVRSHRHYRWSRRRPERIAQGGGAPLREMENTKIIRIEGQMKSGTKFIALLFLVLAIGICTRPGESNAQGAKMTVGQTGTNPGTALYFIAEKEKLFARHGLDVNIVKTNTAAAVQAMLGGSMQMATGSGAAAFVTTTLEGAPPFVLVGSWVNVFSYKVMTHKDITKVEDLKGKTGHVGAPFGTIPDTALRFALTKLKLDPDKDVKLVQ